MKREINSHEDWKRIMYEEIGYLDPGEVHLPRPKRKKGERGILAFVRRLFKKEK